MRNNYVGDIGDFANNGLLRALGGTPRDPVPDIRLGIIWYLNPGEDRYGNAIGYLNPSRHNLSTYRECDRDLYDELRQLVGQRMLTNTNRDIRDIIDNPNILRRDTQHYDKPILPGHTRETRDQWFTDAMDRTAASDVIFLNPDIGIGWNLGASHQHVVSREVNTLLERRKTGVIYQTPPRRGQTHKDWVKSNVKNLLYDTLAVEYLWVIMWNRAPKRAYFIVASTAQQKRWMQQRLTIFCNSQWVRKGHFSEPQEYSRR